MCLNLKTLLWTRKRKEKKLLISAIDFNWKRLGVFPFGCYIFVIFTYRRHDFIQPVILCSSHNILGWLSRRRFSLLIRTHKLHPIKDDLWGDPSSSKVKSNEPSDDSTFDDDGSPHKLHPIKDDLWGDPSSSKVESSLGSFDFFFLKRFRLLLWLIFLFNQFFFHFHHISVCERVQFTFLASFRIEPFTWAVWILLIRSIHIAPLYFALTDAGTWLKQLMSSFWIPRGNFNFFARSFISTISANSSQE